MHSATLIPVVAASVVLFLAPGWLRASEESFEADCRVCHDVGVPDLHHVLNGLPVAPDSQVPYFDADGNGIQDASYGCLNCHGAMFTVVRDCIVCHNSPAGTVPDGSVPPENPVTLVKTVGAGITLSWDPSCDASDTDFAVYEGVLGSFASHTPVVCSTAGIPSATFAPFPVSTYYVVVARNHWSEGSYGVDSDGLQRPPSASACFSQSIGCPWP